MLPVSRKLLASISALLAASVCTTLANEAPSPAERAWVEQSPRVLAVRARLDVARAELAAAGDLGITVEGDLDSFPFEDGDAPGDLLTRFRYRGGAGLRWDLLDDGWIEHQRRADAIRAVRESLACDLVVARAEALAELRATAWRGAQAEALVAAEGDAAAAHGAALASLRELHSQREVLDSALLEREVELRRAERSRDRRILRRDLLRERFAADTGEAVERVVWPTLEDETLPIPSVPEVLDGLERHPSVLAIRWKGRSAVLGRAFPDVLQLYAFGGYELGQDQLTDEVQDGIRMGLRVRFPLQLWNLVAADVDEAAALERRRVQLERLEVARLRERALRLLEAAHEAHADLDVRRVELEEASERDREIALRREHPVGRHRVSRIEAGDAQAERARAQARLDSSRHDLAIAAANLRPLRARVPSGDVCTPED